MTCSEFAKIARDVARAAGTEAAQAHLDQCAGCRERLEAEKQLTQGLAALAASMEPVAAPPGVERRLRQAFRARHSAETRRPALWRWLPWAAPVAAALAGAAILVSWSGRGTDSLGGANAVARLAASAPKLTVAGPAPVSRIPTRRTETAQVRARKRAPRPERVEEVLRFTPVRFAQPLFPGEAAEIIRVNLPGAAMRRFGVYVPPEFAVRRVNADVLFGEDGVARAIRFVR